MANPTPNDVHVNTTTKPAPSARKLNMAQLKAVLARLVEMMDSEAPDAAKVNKLYPNEHAARQLDPSTHRVVGSKEIISGVRMLFAVVDGKTVAQSLRFNTANFTADEAKAWLKAHNYSTAQFEAASVSPNETKIAKQMQDCALCGNAVEEDELTEVDGKMVCEDCAEEKTETGIKKDIDVETDILKADNEKRIAYGIVYPAMQAGWSDSQGDRASSETIEAFAHAFMLKSRRYDIQHQRDALPTEAVVVESYLAPVDFEMNGHAVTKGSWVVATHFPDAASWELVKSGKVNAYSIRGKGKRKPIVI